MAVAGSLMAVAGNWMTVAGNLMTAAGSRVNHSKGFEISPKYLDKSISVHKGNALNTFCMYFKRNLLGMF